MMVSKREDLRKGIGPGDVVKDGMTGRQKSKALATRQAFHRILV